MKRIYYIIVVAVLWMSGCDEKKLEPITPSLGKPGVPSEVKAEPIAGGSFNLLPNSRK